MKPTLEEFFAQEYRFPKSLYVSYKGFRPIYVRKFHDTLTIANITANKPGKGHFTKLLQWLHEHYAGKQLILECVGNERFARYLLARGFQEIQGHPTSYKIILGDNQDGNLLS